jgi:hypothetical protein
MQDVELFHHPTLATDSLRTDKIASQLDTTKTHAVKQAHGLQQSFV